MKNNSFKDWLSQAFQTLKKLPWVRIGLISLCSILSLALIAAIFVTAYVDHLLGQIIADPEMNDPNTSIDYGEEGEVPPDYEGDIINPDDLHPNTTPEVIIAHKDIVNIMLVGQDRREGETGRTRSDAMILCTFNKKTKTITMTSFMRDLYVNIPGHKPYKMNSAYQWGGMPLLRQTMLENFGVKVDVFVEVDFSGFTQVINSVGGVNINLTQAEADLLNVQNGWTLRAGNNLLNGDQALAYSRIRSIGMDFARTERQRNVINALIAVAKDMSLAQLSGLINTILPLVATDIPTTAQAMSYVMDLFPVLSGSKTVTQRIPIDGSYQLVYVGNLDVVLPDMDINRQFLINTLLPK